MPLYSYLCECGAKLEAIRTVANRRRVPRHCGRKVSLEIVPTMIAPMFEPYKAVGTDGRWIRTKAEHRDMLKEFGKEEIGNDSSIAPPNISDEEFEYNRQKEVAEMERDLQQTSKILQQSGIDLANSLGES